MLIAVGGIMHESNTFLPLTTGWKEFEEGSISRGAELVKTWGEAHHEMGGFLAGAQASGYDAVPTVMAWATPSGPVADEVLDGVAAEIIAACQKEKVDGLLLALHGAMVTRGHPSGDTEVLRRLRAALGPTFPLVVSLDYHGNCTTGMAEHAHAIVGYQTYPHVDQRERGLLAGDLIARMVRGEIRPVTFIAKPPLILNLLGQDTAREPMASLLKRARQVERRPGMLSVSIMAGFPYADVPPMGPAVISVADGDRALAEAAATELADAMWAMRHELYVPCPLPEEAVRLARASSQRPVVLVDLGDNVGGGSAADGTVLLAELLKQKATGAVVTLFSHQGVREAFRIGVGGTFDRAVGGAVDRLHGDPVHIHAVVRSLHDGKWVETEARHGGRRHNDQGHTAVLEIDGLNTLVLNTLRTPPFSLGQLTSLGIDPKQAHILVVKAAVAYKAAYAPLQPRVIEVDTPGATAINPARFPYQHIRRPLFPLDE